jgi:hypothetical protein
MVRTKELEILRQAKQDHDYGGHHDFAIENIQ